MLHDMAHRLFWCLWRSSDDAPSTLVVVVAAAAAAAVAVVVVVVVVVVVALYQKAESFVWSWWGFIRWRIFFSGGCGGALSDGAHSFLFWWFFIRWRSLVWG
jgi:hypothetical protein